MIPGVTAAIPVHLPRLRTYLHRALDSVLLQTHPVDALSVAVDKEHEGAGATRNRALAGVRTEWTAFLDSDDEWLPEHIALLLAHAEETGADLVYPWFTVPAGWDPLRQFEGKEFRGEWLNDQNMIPITVLVRTEMLRDVGGFEPRGPAWNPCEDYAAWLKLRDAGAKIVHLNRRTWLWHWHSGNTSGRGDAW